MSDFDRLSAAFLSSFEAQPGAFFHGDIKLTDLRSRHEGRGILATADIPADTVLFVIPRDYVISVENSELAEKLPQVFADDDNSNAGADESVVEDVEEALTELPKPWLDLILVMIYEYFHRDVSRWKAYWDVLPDTFDTLMFWSDEELAELQASTSRKKIGKEDADAMFRKMILPVVNKYQDVFYAGKVEVLDEDDLLTLAHRMGSLIMSYAFDLERETPDDEADDEDGWVEDREGKMAMGMVPMADMLNADAEFNAHLEHGENALTMRSLRAIKRGEEVLNYYGPLPNSDLLRRYGYTSEKHSRYDVIEIEWGLVRKAIQTVLGSLPNVESDEELEEGFVLERDTGEPSEDGINHSRARFVTFPEELMDQVTLFASAGIKLKDDPQGQRKRDLKQQVAEILAKVVDARLAEYKTTVAQDVALLKGLVITDRMKMAVDVRLGEKRLLVEAKDVVAELLAECSYANKDTDSLGRNAKKRKIR